MKKEKQYSASERKKQEIRDARRGKQYEREFILYNNFAKEKKQ